MINIHPKNQKNEVSDIIWIPLIVYVSLLGGVERMNEYKLENSYRLKEGGIEILSKTIMTEYGIYVLG